MQPVNWCWLYFFLWVWGFNLNFLKFEDLIALLSIVQRLIWLFFLNKMVDPNNNTKIKGQKCKLGEHWNEKSTTFVFLYSPSTLPTEEKVKKIAKAAFLLPILPPLSFIIIYSEAQLFSFCFRFNIKNPIKFHRGRGKPQFWVGEKRRGRKRETQIFPRA